MEAMQQLSSNQTYRVAASARIDSAPARVYCFIADYQNKHARILPPQFTGLTVERGGVGAGTIIAFQMRAFGIARTARAAITEPAPGRVLVETGLEDFEAVTTFTVDPLPGGGSEVTISTILPAKTGIGGAIERFVTTGYLRRLYSRELALLAQCAAAPDVAAKKSRTPKDPAQVPSTNL